MQPASVRDAAAGVGVALDDAQCGQFVRYHELLLEWNARFNLTAITDEQGVLTRHFADSLTALRALPASARTLLDVGSGAGMPGLPLKIARPDLAVTLMEGTGKKVAFLNTVIQALKLGGVSAVHRRAEEAAHDPQWRERFDVVIARAVAPLPTLAEYILPLAAVGGVCVAMKGSDARAELADARAAIRTLGGELDRVEDVTLAGLADARALIVVAKRRPTPAVFPRAGGKPRSSPLG